MDDTTYAQILLRLHAYLAKNHSVILDGPLATKDENEKERDHHALDDLLGLEYKGLLRVVPNTAFELFLTITM